MAVRGLSAVPYAALAVATASFVRAAMAQPQGGAGAAAQAPAPATSANAPVQTWTTTPTQGAGTGGLAVTLREGPEELPLPTAEVPPPRPSATYLEYGVAFTAEFVANPGPVCDSGPTFCILGSGGGLVIPRIGWRSGSWYFGGAFEVSKQDPNKLYRLAVLKQLRAEARYYFYTARVLQPFVAVAAGVAGYGDEIYISTFGPTGFVGAGLEGQIRNGPLIGLLIGYRPIYLQRFDDGTGTSRPPGVAHLVGLELTLETQERQEARR